jgi:hypothetical protein
MRVEIDLSIDESAGKLLRAVGWTALRQLVSEVLGVVVSEVHAGVNASTSASTEMLQLGDERVYAWSVRPHGDASVSGGV